MTALAATGVRVAALEGEPEVPDTLVPALLALRDLDGERAVGFVAGPIPWRAILEWAKEYRVPCRESFIELVQAGDRALLSARDAAVERTTAHKRPESPRHALGGADDAVSRGGFGTSAGAGAAMGPRGRG